MNLNEIRLKPNNMNLILIIVILNLFHNLIKALNLLQGYIKIFLTSHFSVLTYIAEGGADECQDGVFNFSTKIKIQEDI